MDAECEDVFSDEMACPSVSQHTAAQPEHRYLLKMPAEDAAVLRKADTSRANTVDFWSGNLK